MKAQALRALLLFYAATALPLSPCGENATTAVSACRSEFLATKPLCTLQKGRVALFMRGEFGAEFTHALPTAYALHRAGLLGATCGCGSGLESLLF